MQKLQRSYYPALDGLRGLAILLVVIYHNFGFIDYFFFGWLGVDLFFVLSGFLITDILLKTRNDPYYLKNFYGRRILRIFPLYYLILIIFLIIMPALNPSFLKLDYYVNHQFWLWFYLQNWLYIFHPSPTNFLDHLWSLAVEEQFYLIWPFVLLVIKKEKTLFIFMLALLLAVVSFRVIIWFYNVRQLAYFNLYTFTRIDGICIGSMLALLRQFNSEFLKKYTSVIVFALAGLNFLFYFINKEFGFTFPFKAMIGYTTFAVLFGILVNEVVDNKHKIVSAIFENRLLKFFGRISYGLYIFHWPVYLIFKGHFSISNNLIQSAIPTIIAIIISVISYEFFEKKFLSLKKNFKYTTVN